MQLIGVYHSNPESPARLSAEDIRLFNDPEPVYIIVSLKYNVVNVAGFKVNKPDDNTLSIREVGIQVLAAEKAKESL